MGGYLWKSPRFETKIENIPSRKRKYTIPGNIIMSSNIKDIPLDQLKLLINDGNCMKIWHPATNSLSTRLLHTEDIDSHIQATAMAITADGSTGIAGNFQGTIDIWNLSTSKCEYRYRMPELRCNRIMHIVTLPENKVAINTEGNTEIYISKLNSGMCKANFSVRYRSIIFMNVTPDGNLIIAYTDGTLVILDPETRVTKDTFIFRRDVVDCTFIHKNEIGVVLENGEVWLLDIVTRDLDIINLGIDATSITTLTTGLIVTGSSDGVIVIWDPENGAIFHKFIAHRDKVTKLFAITEGGFISETGTKLSVWE